MSPVTFLYDFSKISTKVDKCGKNDCYAFLLCIGKTSHSLIIEQTSDKNINMKWEYYILQVELRISFPRWKIQCNLLK